MSTQRASREAKALAFLRVRDQATALEIGAAAVRGEQWATGPRIWKAKQQIGWALAIALARSGRIEATRSNRFKVTTRAA